MSATNLVKSGNICFAAWAEAIQRSALQDMLSVTARPGIISFALGLPAPELFPTMEYGQAVSRVLATDARALQYGPPFQPLKTHIVELMARRGVSCKESQVFLTTGAQQGMNLIARLLLDPGGEVITEEMTYTGFQQVIEPFQPTVLTVPTNLDTGMDVDKVEFLLARGARPAFIYAVTDGHNPLGVSLSAEKRARLVELARTYRVPILEDDAYGFLFYDQPPLPPMRALDDEYVFYAGSFSKILAPSLRVGWLVVPELLVPKLSIIKEATDIDTSTLAQRSISAYLDAKQIDDHLANLRNEYGRRRDSMLESLEKSFPAGARWRKPVCGVFIWVELPDEVDATKLLMAAVESQQVAYIPGQAFYTSGGRGPANCMRLNFSNPGQDQIREGIARLACVLQSSIAH